MNYPDRTYCITFFFQLLAEFEASLKKTETQQIGRPKVHADRSLIVFSPFQCELKQTTGIGKCQSRQHRGQRNHIACYLWVWISLIHAARAAGQTINRTDVNY